MYSIYQEETQTELLASGTMPCLFMPSESTTTGKLSFCLLTQGLRPSLSSQDWHNYTNQAELF